MNICIILLPSDWIIACHTPHFPGLPSCGLADTPDIRYIPCFSIHSSPDRCFSQCGRLHYLATWNCVFWVHVFVSFPASCSWILSLHVNRSIAWCLHFCSSPCLPFISSHTRSLASKPALPSLSLPVSSVSWYWEEAALSPPQPRIDPYSSLLTPPLSPDKVFTPLPFLKTKQYILLCSLYSWACSVFGSTS